MQSSGYKFGILPQKAHWIYIIINSCDVGTDRVGRALDLNGDSRVSGCVEEWGEDVGRYEGVEAGVEGY